MLRHRMSAAIEKYYYTSRMRHVKSAPAKPNPTLRTFSLFIFVVVFVCVGSTIGCVCEPSALLLSVSLSR